MSAQYTANRTAERIRAREEMGSEILPDRIANRLYRIWGASDVERWFEWAKSRDARVVIRRPTLEQLSSMDLVPNEPFRLVYERTLKAHKRKLDEAIVKELRRLEERDKKPVNAYGSRSVENKQVLQQHLGVKTNQGTVRIFMDYPLAEACCKAMGLAPTECGI